MEKQKRPRKFPRLVAIALVSSNITYVLISMYHYTEADLKSPAPSSIVTTSDEQTQAQAELDAYLEQQAQAIKRETTNTVAKRERSTSPIQEGDKVFYLVCLNDFTRRIACNDEELDWTWCSAIVKKVYKKTVDLEYRIEHTHTLFHAKKVKISRLRREVKDSYSVAVYDGFETQRADSTVADQIIQ